MRQTRKKRDGERGEKTITVHRQSKKTSLVVQYSNGRRVETHSVEIKGNATISLDSNTREPVLRTTAEIALGNSRKTCAMCGEPANDQHAHA